MRPEAAQSGGLCGLAVGAGAVALVPAASGDNPVSRQRVWTTVTKPEGVVRRYSQHISIKNFRGREKCSPKFLILKKEFQLMASLNRTTLIGNLGADPEIRYLPDGAATATVSLATTETWKDKTSGERMEKTEWHRVVFFRGLAEIVSEYLKKGSQIYVEGKLRTRKWTDKNGVERYTTEIVGREMQMLGKKDSKDVPNAPKTDAPPDDETDMSDIPF